MKKGASPLRIPARNSPRKVLPEGGTNTADGNPFLEPSARDHGFLRPPLCPIPESNSNLLAGANTEQDMSTPRTKSDNIVPFPARGKLFTLGSGQGLTHSGENAFRLLNYSTPDSDLTNISTGFSHSKNRFGWHETKCHSSNAASEMDVARFSSGLTRVPSHGSMQEMGLLNEPMLVSMGNLENVSATPNYVARSLKYNQSVTASTGSLPVVCSAESQHSGPVKSLLLESKNNFMQSHFELQEDPSFWDDHNVQVVIRIRPLSSIEIASQGHSRCVRQDSPHTLTWLGHPESRFTFDLVAGEKISQEKLFKVAGLPMVENCMGGYNSCMFAYGQTGSGKTHTMLGDIDDAEQKLSANSGMTPRVFEHLFTRIHKEEDTKRDEKLKFICKCSFLEIYNEQVIDLLEPSSMNLQMREDAKKGVYVENLSEFEVKDVNDVIRLLLQGAANRKVAATNMNRASSRSHSVFTCVIESKWESQSVTHHRFGRLNLVDLAGSERQKSSGAEGERLKEATNINKSLSTLGLVIMNLVNTANGKAQHVPYRDSKLTFLLQDSLGGNSKTIIIANVSPSNCCTMETLSTLKFAQRAKFIRNNATVNENATGDVISLKMQIQQLKEENNRLRGKLKGGIPEPTQEDDYGNISLLSSPGSNAWDSRALASPLLLHKKAPRRRDLESALAGSLKREQATETKMKAMAAELEQAKRLVKQREEDAQCGKMMLRFREDKIKRLEAVASDKMSAEAHLLEERNVLMEELQLLRNRVDRNPEVTRFAMENIRLMEQLRRFQEFYEGGEQDQMEEQIAVLRDQLLEALDWKLMHEQDPNLVNQKEPSEADSATSEEIEMLHRQVDQHRREAEALRNNLSFCLEAKEKLERRVDDLMTQIDNMKLSNGMGVVDLHTATEVADTQEGEAVAEGLSAQGELKDLVEAISAASQREAEAQGTAIILARKAEDLHKKLKESVEDNERLIYMYEKAMQERDEVRKAEKDALEAQEKLQEQVFLLRNQVEKLQKEIEGRNHTFKKSEYTNNWPDGVSVPNSEAEPSTVHLRQEVEDLQLKLQDTSEENERLLELYEKAMQERDDVRRMWWNCGGKSISGQQVTDTEAREQAGPRGLETLIEEDNQEKFQKHANINRDSEAEKEVICLRREFKESQMKLKDMLEENERLIDMYEKAMQEKDEIRRLWQDSLKNQTASEHHANVRCEMESESKMKAEQLGTVLQEGAEGNMGLSLLGEESVLGKDCEDSQNNAMDGYQSAWQVKHDTPSEVVVMSPSTDLQHFEMLLKEIKEKNKIFDKFHEIALGDNDFKEEINRYVMILEEEVKTLQMKLKYIRTMKDTVVEVDEESIHDKDEHQKESRAVPAVPGKYDIKNREQKEWSFSSDMQSGCSEQNLDLQQQDLINQIENLQAELGRRVRENEKLVKMYENATWYRNELVKLWQTSAEALKQDNIATSLQMLAEIPIFSIVPNEIEDFKEMKRDAETKGLQTSENDNGILLKLKESVQGISEQTECKKKMDENPEFDSIFSFLRKEVDELKSKGKKTTEEYEKLVIMYEEIATEKENIGKALQQTIQELENSMKERTVLLKEIEDLKSKLKALAERNEDTFQKNQKHLQEMDTLQVIENLANNVNSNIERVKKDLEINLSEELQLLMARKETSTNWGNAREGTAVDSTVNAGSSGALNLHAWNEEKLRVLQEHEQLVQNKFDQLDLKLQFFGESMDNLNMIKEKLESDLEFICNQATELASNITEKEKKLQAMQLEHENLEMRLQESEQSKEDLGHLLNVENGKWTVKEAGLQRDRDLLIKDMANRENSLLQELTLARSKLTVVQERVDEITQLVDSLSMLEKSHKEMKEHIRKSESLKQEIAYKKKEIDTLQTCTNEIEAKRIRAYNKLSALKTLMSDYSASEAYWKSRESRANTKVETLSHLMSNKVELLANLQAKKEDLQAAIKQNVENEAIAKAKVCELKEKFEIAEQQRVDAEKTVVQLDKQANLCPDLRSSAEHTPMHFGKAASLLKGEEERIKLSNALKKFTEQVKEHRENIKQQEAKLKLVESSIQQVQSEINAESAALKEAEHALQRTLNEKQILIESQEDGRQELHSLILDLQSSEFEVEIRKEEVKQRMEDLENLINILSELENKGKTKQELEPEHCFLSQQVLAILQDVHESVCEASKCFLRLPVRFSE